MPATLFGTTGLVFGLTEETGGIIQSLDIRQNTDKAETRDNQGAMIGIAYYNPSHEVTGAYTYSAATGLGAAAPAAALTLVGFTPVAGLLLVEEVTIKQTNTSYKTVDFKAMVYPLITA